MKNELHPDDLIEGEKYEITMADGKVVRARFLKLATMQKKLVLLLRASGHHGFLRWLDVATMQEYK